MRSLTRGRIASAVHYLFVIGVVCAICGSVRVLLAQSPTSSTAVQAPSGRAQFEARAELVLVDVSVTSNDSRPVTDLSAADFDLEVNGQPRPIVAIQYISTLTEAPDTPPAADAPSSNDAPTSGRLMLFVVDDGHIRVGSAQAVVRTSEMLLEQLAPGDLVGVARLPTGVGSVEFTTDRQRVLNALRRPAGTASATLVSQQVQISEAFALETGDTDTWARAISRECAGLAEIEPRDLRRRTGGRGANRHHRSQREGSADAALPRSVVHPAGPAEYAGQRHHAVRRPLPRTRARQHGGRLAARGRSPGDAPRRAAHAVDDGRCVAGQCARHELLVRRLLDARWPRAAGEPDAWAPASGFRRHRRGRLRAPQPRALRLLPGGLRADRGRSHRATAAHQGAGAAPRPRRARATDLRAQPRDSGDDGDQRGQGARARGGDQGPPRLATARSGHADARDHLQRRRGARRPSPGPRRRRDRRAFARTHGVADRHSRHGQGRQAEGRQGRPHDSLPATPRQASPRLLQTTLLLEPGEYTLAPGRSRRRRSDGQRAPYDSRRPDPDRRPARGVGPPHRGRTDAARTPRASCPLRSSIPRWRPSSSRWSDRATGSSRTRQ